MLSGYFELGVKIYPETKLKLDQLSSISRSLGYRGLGICNHSSYFFEFPLPARVFQGIEILARDSLDLKLKIKHYSKPGRYLAVHGGNPKINLSAARSRKIHILAHPGSLDRAVVSSAASREVGIQFDLSPLIWTRGSLRSQHIRRLSRNFELVSKYDAPYLISLNPGALHEFRSPKDLICLAELIGISRAQAKMGLMDYPGWILESCEE